jgi:Uri superfamily endonuclease
MKGAYVLVVSVDELACIKVGALGRVSFRRGLYAYVGSGQVGLHKRVARHLRRSKKRFWHIDYLLDSGAANVVRVFWKDGEKSEECHVAEVLGELGVPIAGFGCSDCRCRSHLFRISDCGFLGEFMRELPLKRIRSVR